MSYLIEVKINEEMLVQAIDNNSTVSEIATLALKEYEKAYRFQTPKTIQLVKDGKGRILSGNLRLIELNLDKYIELVLDEEENLIPRMVDPKNVLNMYGRWQEYAARQMNGYCQYLPQGETPTKESIQLLSDLKSSKVVSVQNSVIQSFCSLLEKCRNELIHKVAIDGLLDMLMNSDSPIVVISCMTLLFQIKSGSVSFSSASSSSLSQLIDGPQLMRNISLLTKKFPNNETEILNLCDQYGTTSSLLSSSLSQQQLQSQQQQQQQQQQSSQSNPNNLSPNRREMNANLSSIGGMEGEMNTTDGMSFERILYYLSSEDTRCQVFALGKLEKKDKLNEQNYMLQIVNQNKPSDSYQLLRALFNCLKLSLKPPAVQTSTHPAAHHNHTNNNNNNNSHLPLTYYIIENVLNDPQNSLPLIQSIMKCIYQLIQLILQRGDQWLTMSPNIFNNNNNYNNSGNNSSSSNLTLESIVSERLKLLFTITHCNELKYDNLSEMTGHILLLFIRACGWNKYRIKLEYDSIVYFLNSDRPLMRTFLGIEYLIHCIDSSMKENNSTGGGIGSAVGVNDSNRKRNTSIDTMNSINNGSVVDVTSQAYLLTLLCDENYHILRLLWRWMIGNYNLELSMKSLQCYANTSGLISIKKYLVTYKVCEKLLMLLQQYVDTEINSLKESIQRQSINNNKDLISEEEQSIYNRKCIGYILKMLVNINGTSHEDNIFQLDLSGTQLGSNIRLLATIDDIISFYSNLLGIGS